MVTAETSTDTFEIDVAPFPKCILAHTGSVVANSQGCDTNKPLAVTVRVRNPQRATGQTHAVAGLQVVEVVSKLLTSQHQ